MKIMVVEDSPSMRAYVTTAVEELPLWQQPWLVDLLRSAAAPVALALVALVLVFSLVRPALKAALAPAPAPAVGGRIDEVVGGDPALPTPAGTVPALAAPQQADRIESARALARQK